MPLKALFLCLIATEAYICLGGIMFYLMEFSNLPKKNKTSKREVNMTELLQEFEHAHSTFDILIRSNFREIANLITYLSEM